VLGDQPLNGVDQPAVSSYATGEHDRLGIDDCAYGSHDAGQSRTFLFHQVHGRGDAALRPGEELFHGGGGSVGPVRA
jgi:hypothetical protein